MAYVRITLLAPRESSRETVQQLQDQLLTFFTSQAGFLDGYRLLAADRVGRITVWNTEADADRVANSQHVLALRSRLLPLLERDEELAFSGEHVKP